MSKSADTLNLAFGIEISKKRKRSTHKYVFLVKTSIQIIMFGE